jgi:hypothetical protein
MADMLLAVWSNFPPTEAAMEKARGLIDEAFLATHEELLELTSPDERFRHDIVIAVAKYLSCPDPALEHREALTALRAYFRTVQKHLLALQRLLPKSDGEHSTVESNFVFEILRQQAKTKGRFGGRDVATLRRLVDGLAEATNSAILKVAKYRVPPNSRLDGAAWLVRRLAETFQARTGKNPRKHVRSNTAKDQYCGIFFALADDVLQKCAVRQANSTRGKMISNLLRRYPANS